MNERIRRSAGVSPAGQAASRRLPAKLRTSAGNPAARTPPSQPAGRQRSGLSTRLRASAVALLLLLTACASAPKAPPPPRLPQWNAMPAAVLDSFCSNFRDEGISMSTTINVVKTAQPSLITPLSMQSLSDSFFYHGPLDSSRAAATATATATDIPIVIPQTCAWRGIAPNTASRYIDTMTLELSPPIANPYARNAAGLFARMALAGESPTWYWLPLIPRGETWTAGRLTVLPYRQ